MKEKLAQALEIEFHYTEVGFKNESDRNKRAKMIWYAPARFGRSKSRTVVRFAL